MDAAESVQYDWLEHALQLSHADHLRAAAHARAFDDVMVPANCLCGTIPVTQPAQYRKRMSSRVLHAQAVLLYDEDHSQCCARGLIRMVYARAGHKTSTTQQCHSSSTIRRKNKPCEAAQWWQCPRDSRTSPTVLRVQPWQSGWPLPHVMISARGYGTIQQAHSTGSAISSGASSGDAVA